jgi:hypothetical protein
MTDNFISTQEAGKLIGVNKRTVQRRADSYLKSQNLALDQASHLIEARDMGGGRKKYFVSKEFVLKHLVDKHDAIGKSGTKDDAFATRQLLQQLETKDLQIQTKDDQIAAKDEQIKSLNDRLHESHVLLTQEQQLHIKALDRKRPLLTIGNRTANSAVSSEKGNRRIGFGRVASASAIGFTALVVIAAALLYFQ